MLPALLPDGAVDADHLREAQVPAPLVDDRVDDQRGFPGIAVTDEELALSPADRRERVHDLQPVFRGVSTGARFVTPGAILSSATSDPPVTLSGFPSRAVPNGSMTRPSRSSDT